MFDKKEYQKKYRLENKKEIREYRKKYDSLNKDKIKEYMKLYGKINRSKINAYKKSHKSNFKKYNKTYNEKHRNTILPKQKLYRQLHKNEMRIYRINYYKNNKKYLIERAKDYTNTPQGKLNHYFAMKRYREKYPDLIRERGKVWRQSPRGKLCNRIKEHNRRLKTKDLTPQVVEQVYKNNIKKYGVLTCYLCLKPIKSKEDSLEHKNPIKKGGTNEISNLEVAHLRCNFIKGSRTEEEYYQYLLQKNSRKTRDKEG